MAPTGLKETKGEGGCWRGCYVRSLQFAAALGSVWKSTNVKGKGGGGSQKKREKETTYKTDKLGPPKEALL